MQERRAWAAWRARPLKERFEGISKILKSESHLDTIPALIIYGTLYVLPALGLLGLWVYCDWESSVATALVLGLIFAVTRGGSRN
jgi:hypothetical protein